MEDINQPSQGDPAAQGAGVGQQRVGETGPGPDQTASPFGTGPSGPGAGDSASDATAETERGPARQTEPGAVALSHVEEKAHDGSGASA